jgi:hypothetical protein
VRWVLISLLMCNGIYYLWQSSSLPQEMRSPASHSKLVLKSQSRSLVLLRELPPQRKALNLGDEVPEAVSIDTVEASSDIGAARIAEANDLQKMDVETFCWSIGPFPEQVSAKQAVSRLSAVGINLAIKTVTVPSKPDYWVYIPPLPTLELSVKLLRELQSKEIDSFLITSGELDRGLSLGLFSQEDRAVRVHEARLHQGYDAKIKIVERSYREFWGVISRFQYDKFTDSLWKNIKRGNKGLEKHKNFCDKIASANNLD